MEATDVFQCLCLECRFNAMNLYRGSDKARKICTFQSIRMSPNASCEMFEDCADHGETSAEDI